MSNSYKNPVIIELLAEVTLPPGQLTPERFFQVVPMLQSKGLGRVEFVNVGQIAVNANQGSIQQTNAPRVRCWDQNSQRLIQLSPDLVVVNLIGKYPGWRSFRDLFSIAMKALQEANLKGRSSLALRTIDRFEVVKSAYSIDQYVNCEGPCIPANLKGSKSAIDLILGHGNLQLDLFNRQFKLRASHKREKMEIFAESTFHDILKETDDIDVVLEKLHDESVQHFESWITAKTREEIMGGLK